MSAIPLAPGMRSRSPRVTRALALGFAMVLLGTAAAAAQNFGGGPVNERYFRLEYEAVRSGSGSTTIRGSIRNTYDLGARNVQLLVEALDPAGGTVATTRGYVTGDVAAEGSRTFEVRAPGPGVSYRVKVVNWEWLCRDGPM